jgi:hypothetical protein
VGADEGNAIWDAGEAGMSEAQIKAKRLAQLYNVAASTRMLG